MKIEICTVEKTILVKRIVNIGELINTLEKLLPGEWKTYKLISDVQYVPYPYYNNYIPAAPAWPIITCENNAITANCNMHTGTAAVTHGATTTEINL